MSSVIIWLCAIITASAAAFTAYEVVVCWKLKFYDLVCLDVLLVLLCVILTSNSLSVLGVVS